MKSKKSDNNDIFIPLVKATLGIELIPELKFHPVRKWRFDYACEELKIALEVEGGVWTRGRHTSPKGFLNDMEKYNAATIMGWRVVRTTPDKLLTEGIDILHKMLLSL